MTIGHRIKEQRIKLGLSADDLAKKLGKNRATIYRYEKGEIENLPLDVLEPLAKSLETTPAHLMGWDNNPNEEIKLSDYNNSMDISKEMGKILEQLHATEHKLTVDGKPLDENTRDLLISSLENSLKVAKMMNNRKE